jgi:hypothetical protein|tara:strand:+ start:46 stop:1953 length:1908 start_codon:yes stop_codon:yes gene_type:complete
MAGITNISFLTRPVQGYDNGGEIVNPNTAAQDLGISDSLTQDTITTFKPAQYLKNLIDQQVERIGPENLQDMSNRVTNRAVSEVSDRIAEMLKNKGYKISFDWKGFTNWMLGKDAQGNPKPFKSAKQNRQALKDFINKTPAGGARKIIIREGLNLVNQIAPNLSDTVKDAWSELTSTDDKPDYYTARQDQQNEARKEAGIKAKEIFEANTDKPFYSKNEGVVSIFDLISQETGYKSRPTVVKMLQEQGVDISPTVKPGVKPDNFSELVKESKDKSTKKYQKSITEQVLQIYEANKDLPMTTGKENQPTIMEIMQENIPSFQTGQKVSLKTIKEILQNEDVYEHTASGEPKAGNLETGVSKITGEKLTEFSPMFTRGIDLKEFPSIGKLNKFFRSQGIELENLNEILSNNPEKFNDLEATRKKIQIEFLSPDTAKSEESIAFNKALATQAENYDRNGNFMPIVLQKMHPNESLRPQDIESQFGSIDIENVRLGGSTVNTVVQPQHAKALQTYIKNKDVENTNRIINTLEEYHILTNLNNMLDKEDYQWLEQNKIIEIPKISYKGEEFPNTDAVMFGAKESPSIEQIIEAELKARKNFGLKYSVYQEMKDKGEKLPAFDTYLKDGGIVGISHLTRPL